MLRKPNVILITTDQQRYDSVGINQEEPDRIRFKCWVTPQWKLAVYSVEAFGELYDLQKRSWREA